MTPELTVLVLAALWQVATLAVASVFANLEAGVQATASSRDDGPLDDKVSVRTARLIRAYRNHFEALAWFTIAVVVVTLAEASSPLTVACAWTYLVARILYVPAYALGLVPWRSVIWFVGFGATLVMLIKPLVI